MLIIAEFYQSLISSDLQKIRIGKKKKKAGGEWLQSVVQNVHHLFNS